MTFGARAGILAAAILLVALAAGSAYVWQRPLAVYAALNRRALARAGLVESSVPSPAGPQSFWSGGSGPALVLLHGAGDSAGTFASSITRLPAKYRLVIPDLAGHGRSAPASGPISVGDILAGVEAVMARATAGPAVIAGNSLGAWVALLYAQAHPDRVSRLVLVNGGALVGDRPDLSLMPTSREEAAALMSQLQDPSSPRMYGFVLDDVVRQSQAGPIARLAMTSGGMGQYVLDGRLHEIRVPVDLLWGEADRLLPPDYARRMMAQLPASRLTLISRCGHVPSQECPSRFAAALEAVLEKEPPSSAVKQDEAGPAGAPGASGG